MNTESEFLAQLRETFRLEAEEHLKVMSDHMLEIEKDISNANSKNIETIYREVHSLKGASRAVNHTTIEPICQTLENVMSAWKNNTLALSKELIEVIFATIDLLTKTLTNVSEEERKAIPLLVKRLEDVLHQNPPSAPEIPVENISREVSVDKISTIRVQLSKLDKLLQTAEEMLTVKLTSKQVVSYLKEIEKLIYNNYKEWSEIQKEIYTVSEDKNTKLLKRCDKHGTQLRQLSINFNRFVKYVALEEHNFSSLIDNLIDKSKKVILQPFSIILDPFHRMVRDISNSLKKEINFKISGENIEVDKRILENIKDPLTHLIRNSIDHGIEKPEIREIKHKSRRGTIAIHIQQLSGNHVQIEVSDDGQGILIDKVKEKALENKLYTQTELNQMSDEQIVRLILLSGISTSTDITELSGRGLGAGIVQEKVEKLGGKLFIETKRHLGTTFRIVLPVTLATFRGIHIKESKSDFIFPSNQVLRVLAVKPEDLRMVENKPALLWNKTTIPYVPLSHILELPTDNKRKSKRFNALILHASDTTVAIGVDEICNEQEVLVKSLGKNLVRIRNISSATILEGGKIVLILDPLDIIKSILKGKLSISDSIIPKKEKGNKSVLVVEDSITSRLLLKNILESAGYHVNTAVDGLEGYHLLTQEKYDLVITDFEMPTMNGLELCRKVRANESLKNTPIILCTSLASKEDREKGIEVGANAYIVKSNFAQSNFLEIIQRLI